MPAITSKSPVPTVPPSAEREIRRVVCSAPWFDACRAVLASGRVRASKRLAVALDKAAIYPPGGTKTGEKAVPTRMRRCVNCGSRWYPPQYVHGVSGVCADCSAAAAAPYSDGRTHISTTSSPSAAAIQQLAFRKQRLVEVSLPAEDDVSLRAEIRRAVRDAKRSLLHLENTKKHYS